MKTPSRHIAPYIVATAVAAFLIFLAYVMFFVPKLNETKALEDQTVTVNAANQALALKASILKENAENIGDLEQRVGEFNAAFPPGSSQKDLVASVTRAAEEAGVELVTLNPSVPSVAMVAEEVPADSSEAVETGEPDVDAALESVQADDTAAAEADLQETSVAMVALTINAQGTPQALLVFLEKLEQLERPLLVKTFGIEGEGNLTNLSITAESFFVAPLSKPAEVVDSEEATEAPAPAEGDEVAAGSEG
ncbi:hypothetical protein [Arthrobacter sp. IK3]|uniref:hypothetical protein n=1 Tax=Arthrobacter sp. IK3 TaxID=3448169 RepID=UPI003EE1E38C